MVQAQGSRIRAVEARGKQLIGFAVPGGAVDDGLTVGRKTRCPDCSSSEGEPVERRRGNVAISYRRKINCHVRGGYDKTGDRRNQPTAPGRPGDGSEPTSAGGGDLS